MTQQDMWKELNEVIRKYGYQFVRSIDVTDSTGNECFKNEAHFEWKL